MISLDFSNIQLRLKKIAEKTHVFDPLRRKWLVLTPEEHVRQYVIHFMIQGMDYPASLMAAEKKILVGKKTKRFDLAVYNRDHQPWMLVECKEPEVLISEATLYQLLNYHRTIPCRYWMLTNGHQTFCADASDTSNIKWLDALPVYNR